MADDRLFPLDEIPEVPLLRAPRGSRGALISDERLGHDYPETWNCCTTCGGSGDLIHPESFKVERGRASISRSPGQGGNWARVTHVESGLVRESDMFDSGIANVNHAITKLRPLIRAQGFVCPECKGMGSAKARVRLEAGHRCVRCGHPYMPKGDAKMLGVDPSGVGGDHMGGRWSACGEACTHTGPIRYSFGAEDWLDYGGIAECGWIDVPGYSPTRERLEGARVEAEWRILTVHHLDGDKANLRWWNLAALCQRCHLEIQGRVVMERVYPHEHSAWFRPYVAGYYALVYLGEELDRPQTMARLDELLDLERIAA